MPRESKTKEIEKWLFGQQIVLIEVIYPSFKTTFAVYAESPEIAIDKLKQINKMPDSVVITPLFIAQKIIY
jgi:hypothetical protein